MFRDFNEYNSEDVKKSISGPIGGQGVDNCLLVMNKYSLGFIYWLVNNLLWLIALMYCKPRYLSKYRTIWQPISRLKFNMNEVDNGEGVLSSNKKSCWIDKKFQDGWDLSIFLVRYYSCPWPKICSSKDSPVLYGPNKTSKVEYLKGRLELVNAT